MSFIINPMAVEKNNNKNINSCDVFGGMSSWIITIGYSIFINYSWYKQAHNRFGVLCRSA
jgi:hypothetical protein